MRTLWYLLVYCYSPAYFGYRCEHGMCDNYDGIDDILLVTTMTMVIQSDRRNKRNKKS